jgi:uncharacterized protein (TIGR03083 family)
MPTRLALERHLELIAAAGFALGERARQAGETAPVPTCPRWTVTDLVGHIGMVHRWARANLLGDADGSTGAWKEEAATVPDRLAWLWDGVDDLVATLREVPDDTKAMVFLRDAPSPRRFWARRQAHETTIHSVDALAAVLARVPKTEETGIPPDVAEDGVDELVCGFLPRGKGKPRFEGVARLRISATDTGRSWTMHYSDDEVTTVPDDDSTADVTISGTATQLYLGLWNRGAELAGPAEILDGWKRQARVRWS